MTEKEMKVWNPDAKPKTHVDSFMQLPLATHLLFFEMITSVPENKWYQSMFWKKSGGKRGVSSMDQISRLLSIFTTCGILEKQDITGRHILFTRGKYFETYVQFIISLKNIKSLI